MIGFTGLEIGSEPVSEWAHRKVPLLDGWQAIETERVWLRRKTFRLFAQLGLLAWIWMA